MIRWVVIIVAALLPAVDAQSAKPQKGGSGADWPMYNRDLAGTRYSPLTQINARITANSAAFMRG